ncbi:hypothetical protein DEM28_22405 [Enterobacter mori]|nr:hypothetical protein DEM28_22405 [Enterobacter mori]
MTESKVILAVNSGDGKTRLLTADAGRTVKIKLIAGNKYLLKNVNDDFAPENITLQRVGKHYILFRKGTHSLASSLRITSMVIKITQR